MVRWIMLAKGGWVLRLPSLRESKLGNQQAKLITTRGLPCHDFDWRWRDAIPYVRTLRYCLRTPDTGSPVAVNVSNFVVLIASAVKSLEARRKYNAPSPDPLTDQPLVHS